MGSEHLEFLAEIAGLYYEESLSQSEIAVQTGYSRSMVSRFLAEARQEGLVEIRVHRPIERRQDLERGLQDILHLKQARVVVCRALSHDQVLRRIGIMASRLVEELLVDDMTIGVSWGTTVYETVNAFQLANYPGIHIIQLIGSLGTPDPLIDGPELAQHLANKLAGHYTSLPAPLLVDSRATRKSLMNESRVRRVMEQFRNIQLALVGVGTTDPEQASLLRAGYLSIDQLEQLRQARAVGDVCVIHYDIDGQLVDTPLTKRVVGIDAATLKCIPAKVGIAGGASKVSPIIGAGKAGLINILVTDEMTATSILRRLDTNEKTTNNQS